MKSKTGLSAVPGSTNFDCLLVFFHICVCLAKFNNKKLFQFNIQTQKSGLIFSYRMFFWFFFQPQQRWTTMTLWDTFDFLRLSKRHWKIRASTLTLRVQRPSDRAPYLPVGESSASEAVCQRKETTSGFLLGDFSEDSLASSRSKMWNLLVLFKAAGNSVYQSPSRWITATGDVTNRVAESPDWMSSLDIVLRLVKQRPSTALAHNHNCKLLIVLKCKVFIDTWAELENSMFEKSRKLQRKKTPENMQLKLKQQWWIIPLQSVRIRMLQRVVVVGGVQSQAKARAKSAADVSRCL